jgi:hypothetical protein
MILKIGPYYLYGKKYPGVFGIIQLLDEKYYRYSWCNSHWKIESYASNNDDSWSTSIIPAKQILYINI